MCESPRMVATKEAKALGKKFKDLRNKRGLKGVFVAEQLGIDNTVLSAFEAGRRNLSPEQLEKYTALLA